MWVKNEWSSSNFGGTSTSRKNSYTGLYIEPIIEANKTYPSSSCAAVLTYDPAQMVVSSQKTVVSLYTDSRMFMERQHFLILRQRQIQKDYMDIVIYKEASI